MLNLTIDEFTKNISLKKHFILSESCSADLDTAVSLLLKLRSLSNYHFLLESIEGGKSRGRYSIIGILPDKIWKCSNRNITISTNGEKVIYNDLPNEKIFSSLRNEINNSKITGYENIAPMSSGWFGYMGYDMVQYMENISSHKNDTLSIPEALFIRPEVIVVIDNVNNTLTVTSPVWYNNNINIEKNYEHKKALFQKVFNIIKSATPQKKISDNSKINFKTNINKAEYCKIVKKAKEYIKSGDVFQILPSRRFSTEFTEEGLTFYRALRILNPSPFLFYLHLENFEIIGSSPEIMVKVDNKKVVIRPLAGTRKRGKNLNEDQILAQELLNDQKELAEHMMLLDLGRNDIGRVSHPGSINVTEKMIIEYYSHVMHISSNIEGLLSEDKDVLDALIAGFPAGTVAGAPKIHAMQLISKLEQDKRSFYSGCVGYFSLNQQYMDMAIMLRTALLKDKKLHIQSGAGVVYDSIPEKEFEETENKAMALIKAASMANDKNFLR